MKRTLGLDLGSNSIGWALIEQDFDNKKGNILGLGSRIIPMSQDILGDYDKGNSISQTAERTGYRGIRRLRERHLLRRERLHRVLNILNYLPPHYASQLDFTKHPGQYLPELEPKIAYTQSNEFIFKDSFNEMVADFKKLQPDLFYTKNNGEESKIPYDWTIYYLRKKALTKKLTEHELAWILLNFNQKRGYYQLRGEDEEETSNKLVEFHSLKITDVIAEDKPNARGEIWYSLILENGWIYRRSSKTSLDNWKNKTKDFIVTTEINEDGTIKTNKDGNEKRSFRAPKEDDWTLLKKKTEQQITNAETTVGTYIYDSLLANPNQKIRGKLIRTIERKFYRQELSQILNVQLKFHQKLKSKALLENAATELYKNNRTRQEVLLQQDFVYLFIKDIIFYQRPLRSQKSSISNCSLEFRTFKLNGENQKEYLKCIPKSNPIYQEFRIWQWISNLKIYENDTNTDVTKSLVKDTTALFNFLMQQKEVDHKDVLTFLLSPLKLKGKLLTTELKKYRWNYVYDSVKEESKKYPCNETRALLNLKLKKVIGVPENFLTAATEYQLWHIIYSVTDKKEYEKALTTFAKKHELDEESFVANFKKIPPFKSDYGAFSEKAIKKLLTLMRKDNYWEWKAIDIKTRDRIYKIINGEVDETIAIKIREKAILLTSENHFSGLPLWLASYVIYNRHSEVENTQNWKTPEAITNFLKQFKQHSLRNPIVEQVVTETLRVVKDIWKTYGNGKPDFFSEIHIELGRELKHTAEERMRITNTVTDNENTNLRIKALLLEFLNDTNIENVRPYSPLQQDILKLYEEGALNAATELPDEIDKISKKAEPTKAELIKYKLWLEQKYCSPYTGNPIPLSKLFTAAYEIEHIIPQSRYFDDSLSNKVICEAAVNRLKDKYLGLEFIKKHYGTTVDLGFGIPATIFNEEQYTTFVADHYSKNYNKRTKLLLEEIPEKMVARQMNDTRYVSKFISIALSNIVRENDTDEGAFSKNLIPVTGKITAKLKNDWGLNDIWNQLLLPRFIRMNTLTKSNLFTTFNTKYQKELPTVPYEYSKGFTKKRLDHRHHAMDALIIACVTRDHVNLLNNQAAKSANKRYDLNQKLRIYESKTWKDPKTGDIKTKKVATNFIKPWNTFTQDTLVHLESTIVSFKQNLRVINKATNSYQKYVTEDGISRKKQVTQKGVNWAIRKPMHKDTVSGLIQLQKIKQVSLSVALDDYNQLVNKKLRNHIRYLISIHYNKKLLLKYFKDQNYEWENLPVKKVEIYYWEHDNVASRVAIDDSFTEKKIGSITDSGIQKILLNHLENYKEITDNNGKPIEPHLLAFSPEGLEEMNKNITTLNNGIPHKPIYKVRTYEPKGNKFTVGQTGNKKDKYVEAAKGTNLFFAIYEDETSKRTYETIPLNEVIEHQKWRATLTKQEQIGIPYIPVKTEKGKFLFSLSPNDLVYVLEEDEHFDFNNIDIKKIYKVEKASGVECYFIRNDISTLIKQYDPKSKIGELESQNKLQVTMCSKRLKIVDHCVKLNVNRLGKLTINNHD